MGRRYGTLAQNEAILNEYKGVLFEFLAAKLLASHYGILPSFLETLSGRLGGSSEREKYIRRVDGDLFQALPALAQAMFVALENYLPPFCGEIRLVGRRKNLGLGETDLLLVSGKNHHPLGLKLGRNGSFINTKSGGIKSFFTRYFGPFPESYALQEEINYVLNEAFSEMAQGLHEMVGLEFQGHFDQRWSESGHSELPGQLGPREHGLVMDFYYRLIREVHKGFCRLFETDPSTFGRRLFPLVGLSREDMIQGMCFYGRTKSQKYFFEKSFVETTALFVERIGQVSILPLRERRCSFGVSLGDYLLQIRLKPMNKFTTEGLKVNCSLGL